MNEVDKLEVEVLIDNTTDMFSSRPDDVDSELNVLMQNGLNEASGALLCAAHHGISLLLTAHVGGAKKRLLFDAGPDAQGLKRNANLMGARLAEVDAVFLSHGHFDHAEALPEAIQLVQGGKKNKKVPLYVHPGAFVKRAAKLPNGKLLPYKDLASIADLESLGAKVHTSSKEALILDQMFYLSGEIERESFERGLKNHYMLKENEWVDDPDVIDEKYVAVNVKGKGLVLFTGCSHAGVVNVCNDARKRFPNTPFYGLVGGLHLVYPNEDLIEPTIAALSKFKFKRIIPGHCTGWRAVNQFINHFGEGVVDPLAVGTRQYF